MQMYKSLINISEKEKKERGVQCCYKTFQVERNVTQICKFLNMKKKKIGYTNYFLYRSLTNSY